jgi:MFS family permease
MTSSRRPAAAILARSPIYKWLVVAMLWLVCFFNYADRQAIFAVFPLLKSQMHLTDVQLGVAGSSFMWMYALFGPLAGWLCDRLPRRTLVLGGLVFWSLATACTALSRNYTELVLFRALGGLGEAFYFPASMSLISDYHAVDTRSRAMSIHQSSVYVGSIAGGTLSGLVGQHTNDWRPAFVLFGALGILLGCGLWTSLREPARGMSDNFVMTERDRQRSVAGLLKDVLGNRLPLLLIAVFTGANFVAVIFLVWMPTFLYRKFHLGLAMAGLSGTVYLSLASLLGVLCGGALADGLVKRQIRLGRNAKGIRMLTQSLGLLCGTPFLFLAGWSITMATVIVAMIGFGFFKGLYDANIFASLYDVVPIERRGAAAGMMNSFGWIGGGVAPVAIALASARYGMSACISATAAIYLFFGVLLFWNARRLIERRSTATEVAPLR